ncbi:MAG: glycosyltransferase family 2 protein [Chitinispirillaceae bacterium]|nr:glycosyltransferase family 2 protein [Chitinispirillaceae bacterium]
MRNVSIVIIVKNEEKNIRDCIESLRWSDEIVVVDSGSTDNTVAICREAGCTVICTEWLGFGRTWQLAVEHAKNEWVLPIAADERVSTELAQAIQNLGETPSGLAGYKIRRISRYLGKPIRHCGWQNDYPLRLFRKDSGQFNSEAVHESVEVDGGVGMLREPIIHFPYPDIESHIAKINQYTTLGARMLHEKGKTTSLPAAILRGCSKFLKMYLLRGGILDGSHGLVLSLVSAFGVSLKYLKLWNLRGLKDGG